MNNFNFIAPYYDWLAKLVFGDDIEKSTCHFLQEIDKDDSVLIVGGGTGRILDSIPTCKKITYLEKSEKMLNKAKLRNPEVEFVHFDFLNYTTSAKYDVIIAPFFLDCFAESNLKLSIKKIKDFLTKDGNVIITDFQKMKTTPLMWLMHRFFRLVANLESAKLADIHDFMVKTGFQVEKEEFFHQNMIFSRVYRNL